MLIGGTVMSIGKKIASLRTGRGISQEEMAECLGVSRQTVSKWEADQTRPQIDNVTEMCRLFGISADSLLNDQLDISNDSPRQAGKYFGTDGFRGEANVQLTTLHAYKIGRFLGWYYGKTKQNTPPRIVIGKDTRRSCYTLEYALAAGITASGADAYMMHVTTTPSVSYVTRQEQFDCGIMITASHNPFYDNGIKVINRYGEKLGDDVAALIEAYIDSDLSALGVEGEDLPQAHRENIGRIIDHVAGRNRYVGYLISLASHSYKHLRIGLDCANGASWMIAGAVFQALGAQTVIMGASPDGLNVNKDCGSTHPEQLSELVRKEHLDAAFAFDGDADRCIAIDERGNVLDGDAIMYILARRLQERGTLTDNTVVATLMSNSGFIDSLKQLNINVRQTQVGDRFVYEEMLAGDYMLGGEESGHIILKKYATTGDGLLTAIMLCEAMCDSKATLGELVRPLTLYPQYTENVAVRDKNIVADDPAVKQALSQVEKEIDNKGRILLRRSGTEPVMRVMVECESLEKCKEYAHRIIQVICERGHTDV